MWDRVNGTLKAAAFIGVVLLAGWWTLYLRNKLNEHQDALHERDAALAEQDRVIVNLREEKADQAARIAELDQKVDEQARHIRSLDMALRLLKVDHRLARIEILSQEPGSEGSVVTRLRFTELGPDGQPLGPGRALSVQGERVYVESLVVKFSDEYVEEGDFLRGTSVCLFRRVFGEDEKPSEGAALEVKGRRPRIYAGDLDPDPFYEDLWARFWAYANDPKAAAAKGVRAIHGEAPFLKVEPGQSYLLELRASGGLTFRAE